MALIAGGLALGVVLAAALTDNETSVTNQVKTIIENTTETTIQQLGNLNVVMTIQNLNFNIISSGNVVINIEQTSSGNVILQADVVAEIVTQALMQMSQNANVQSKSFFGIQFSDINSTNITEQEVRNVVRTKISQQTNVNDRKLLTDIDITVNNASSPILPGDQPAPRYSHVTLVAEPVIPPVSGNVEINITQEAVNNITLAATAAIMNELGVTTTVDQEGEIVSSSDPIANFLEGIGNILGVGGDIVLFIVIGLIALILILLIARPPPQQSQPPPYYPQQNQQFSNSEMEQIKGLLKEQQGVSSAAIY